MRFSPKFITRSRGLCARGILPDAQGRYTLKSQTKALIRSDGARHTRERDPCRRVLSVSYVRRGQHSWFVHENTAWYRSGATRTSEKNCSTELRPNLVTAHSPCP